MGKRRLSEQDTQNYKKAKFLSQGLQAASTIMEHIGALSLAQAAVQTGWDIYKTVDGEKKVEKFGPVPLNQGWYADRMTGINKRWTKQMTAIKAVTAPTIQRFIQPLFVANANANKVKQDTIFTNWDSSNIAAYHIDNKDLLISKQRTKVMFTNMTATPQCYIFYYVTPKQNVDNSFETDVTYYANYITANNGVHDEFTSYEPTKDSDLMKAWKVLSKAVVRLNAGETCELYITDRINTIIGNQGEKADTTLTKGVSTQLYCRWYGIPMGHGTTSGGKPDSAMFGDPSGNTSFIVEQEWVYYNPHAAAGKSSAFTSTVTAPIAGDSVYNAGNQNVIDHHKYHDEL